jgi:hypothetical protein
MRCVSARRNLKALKALNPKRYTLDERRLGLGPGEANPDDQRNPAIVDDSLAEMENR